MPNTAAGVWMKFDAPPCDPLGENLLWESRQTRVRIRCDIERRVCLRVRVLGEIVADNPVEQTVICGAEIRRPDPIRYPGRHTGFVAGCATRGSAHDAWWNPSCPTPASGTHYSAEFPQAP